MSHRDRSAVPSPWIVRFASELGPGSRVLDLACGAGRHARMLLDAGHHVTAVDVDLSGVTDLEGHPSVSLRAADLEDGSPWPLPGATFDGVIVTNYLHRPIFPAVLAAVATGGMLLYETFARGNEQYGKPSNPDFLLRPAELLEVVRSDGEAGGFEILDFSQGFTDTPKPAVVQRIAARRPAR